MAYHEHSQLEQEVRMFARLRGLKAVPDYVFLAWRLLQDSRVPAPSKLIFGGAIILVFSPLDVLEWIPGIGGAGVIALLSLAVRMFVDSAPEEVLTEHKLALGIGPDGD